MGKSCYALTLVFFMMMNNSFAASCCGGGQSASSLILGDRIQEWTLSSLFRSDIGQTNNEGESLLDGANNRDQTFTNAIEYKKLLSSRFQSNISINFIQKESKRLGKKENSSGFGDLGVGSFYEAFTNYNYSSWQPRVFFGIKIIIPFGENNFNSKKELRTDIRGTGFYKIDFPAVVARDAWKFSMTPQYLPSQKNLSSTYAFASAGTYTYAINDEFDLSGTLQWTYLADKTYKNQNLISGQYWEVSLAPSWIVTPTLSVNLNYSDSTLIGISRNSALYRSVALGVTWAELL